MSFDCGEGRVLKQLYLKKYYVKALRSRIAILFSNWKGSFSGSFGHQLYRENPVLSKNNLFLALGLGSVLNYG